MEPGFSHRWPTKKQEKCQVVARQILVRFKKKIQQIPSTGTGFSESLENLQPLKFFTLNRTNLTNLQSWPHFKQDVGPNNPQRSYSITVILSYFK